MAAAAPAPVPAVVGTPSRLGSAPINLGALRDDAYGELVEILSRVPGKILLVVDPLLIAPLKLVVAEGSKALREFRVESLLELSPAAPSTAAFDSVLYLTRPAFPMVKAVAAHVRAMVKRWEAGREARKGVHLHFVPRRTFIAEQLLKDEMVHADLILGEFGLDLLPIDDDVVTLAACGGDEMFADCASNGDASHLFLVSRALLKLQATFGPFPHIRSKGPLSRAVVDVLVRTRREDEGTSGGSSSSGSVLRGGGNSEDGEDGSGGGSSTASRTIRLAVTRDPLTGGPVPVSEIHMCVVLDRGVDLVTPLVTPLTFAGQLDEVLLPSRFGTTVSAAAAAASGSSSASASSGVGSAGASNAGGIGHAMAVLEYGLVFDESDERDAAAAAAAAAAAKGLKLAPRPPPPSHVTVHLNSNDKLFTEVRDTNIEAAGGLLAARAKEIAALQDSMRSGGGGGGGGGGDLSVAEIRKMVKAIPGLQADKRSLRVCVALLELLKRETNDPRFVSRWQLERSALDEENAKELGEAVSGMIAKHAPLLRVLRLLCLHSAIEGGLRTRVLDGFRRELVASYGVEETLGTLARLDACGLLTTREGGPGGGLLGGSSWSTLRRVFNLTTPNVDPVNPTDIHFVTSGYAPLSIRLVQAAVAGGGSAWDAGPVCDAMRLLPGPALHVIQSTSSVSGAAGVGGDGEGGEDAAAAAAAAAASSSSGGGGPDKRTTVLVVFIGGVTQVEIAALRFLSERTPVDYIVAATSLIAGPRLLDSMIDRIPNASSGGGKGRGGSAADASDADTAAAAGAVSSGSAAAVAAAATGKGGAAAAVAKGASGSSSSVNPLSSGGGGGSISGGKSGAAAARGVASGSSNAAAAAASAAAPKKR